MSIFSACLLFAVDVPELMSEGFKKTLVESCQDLLVKRNLNFWAIQQGY